MKAMQALIDLVGPTQASKAVGISTTTTHKASKSGEITKAYEMAAWSELERVLARYSEEDIARRPPKERAKARRGWANAVKMMEATRKTGRAVGAMTHYPVTELTHEDERSPNASVVTETVPDAITMPSAPPPAEEPDVETVRSVMLVEGPRKAVEELRRAAKWFHVRTEVDP